MALTHAERLNLVKTALGFGGNNFNDEILEIYIEDAMYFLVDAGVSEEVAESRAAIGAIVAYVNDNYNYSSGEVKHSEAFIKRVIQLAAGSDRIV